MTEVKTRLTSEARFEINEELAGIVPMALPAEQTALTADIAENGQREAIVLWQGKVVDGRCRLRALTMLSMDVLYKELDSSLSEEEVMIFVKSVNTRRNLSLTQKVMSALKDYNKGKKTKSIAATAKAWAIGERTLKNAIYIDKHAPELVEPLFNGQSVKIMDKHGKEVETNKVTSIYAFIKRTVENTVENKEHAWSANSAIKTQAGKEWFYDAIKKHNVGGNVLVMIEYAKLANYMFPEKS